MAEIAHHAVAAYERTRNYMRQVDRICGNHIGTDYLCFDFEKLLLNESDRGKIRAEFGFGEIVTSSWSVKSGSALLLLR